MNPFAPFHLYHSTQSPPNPSYPNVEIYRFPCCGLRVASDSNPYRRASGVGIFFLAGTRFEHAFKKTLGFSKALEKMTFHSKELIHKSSIIGAKIMASNSRDIMAFWGQSQKKHVFDVLRLLVDNIRHPTSSITSKDHKDIERSLHTNPLLRLTERLHSLAYEQQLNNSLFELDQGNKITPSLLRDYTAQMLQNKHKMVVCATGYDLPDLCDHVKELKLCECMEKTNQYDPPSRPEPTVPYLGGRLELLKEPSGEYEMFVDSGPNRSCAHVLLGFNGFGLNEPQKPLFYASMIAQSLLGGGSSFSAGGPGKGMNTRLYKNILTNEWAESSNAFSLSYANEGLFGIYSSCDPHFVDLMVDAMTRELLLLLKHIEPQELQRAKNMLLMQIRVLLENGGILLDDIARQLLLKDGVNYESPSELTTHLHRVNSDDIHESIRHILSSEPSLVIQAPSKYLQAITSQSFDAYKTFLKQCIKK